MSSLFSLLLGLFLFLPSVSIAGPYMSYEKEKDLLWKSIEAKVVAGDKSFCLANNRANMGTCVRAFILDQKIVTAKEMVWASQVIMKAILTDYNAKAMDQVTILIYGTESTLKLVENLKFENTFCGKDELGCAVEKKAYPKMLGELKRQVQESLIQITLLSAKTPVSVQTKSWQQSKTDYIKQNYKAIFDKAGAPSVQVAKAETKSEAKSEVTKEEIAAAEKDPEFIEAKKQFINQLVQESSGYRRLLGCLNIPPKGADEGLKIQAEFCFKADRTPDQMRKCYDDQASQLYVYTRDRAPASISAKVQTCEDKVFAELKAESTKNKAEYEKALAKKKGH